MAEESRGGPANDYLICRSTETDDYSIWRFDIHSNPVFSQVTTATGRFDRTHQMIPIGDYILEWGPITLTNYATDPKAPGARGVFPYRLFRFDPNIGDPLTVNAMHVDQKSGKPSPTLVTKGIWNKSKFWWLVPDFGSPQGPGKEFMKADKLLLLPLGTFILFIIPTVGRGTFKLFQFDPMSTDPLPSFPTPDPTGVVFGSFGTIEFGHELIPLGNYVLDWLPKTRQYWLWSFDPMNGTPLARPAGTSGCWDDIGIDENHQLIPIGEHVLDWDMERKKYRLWSFDPTSERPLTVPQDVLEWSGDMPNGFDAWMTRDGIKGNILTGIQGLCPINPKEKSKPGTIDFMRSKIEHVVYYMVENRSFDHACGWLYEKGEHPKNYVGHEGPFQGAEHAKQLGCDYNVDEMGEKVLLNTHGPDVTTGPGVDLYHDMTDTMRQCFFEDRDGYKKRTRPDMRGFVWNNGNKFPMSTCKPEQLPVLNGLAKHFAVSDEWFCSMPGATDANRAFALTGSALGELNNFMSGAKYDDWPDLAHRASIWKVLWANGFTDWKIYNSIKWFKYFLTYHLFLQNQIPTVDDKVSEFVKGNAKTSDYIGTFDQFKDDAKNGTLPAFSFLEPIWIKGGGSTAPATSYHPLGDLGVTPAETMLNDIYVALRDGKKWDKTLLIITFDEHGGYFDHVPPPRAVNPWPNDKNDGFKYDLMGVRVPCILVSPWIEENTVFRAPEPLHYDPDMPPPVAYDSTSILATLLHWYGIPKGRWALGRRVHQAPTFEKVFQCESARSDKPSFEPPKPFGESPSPKAPGDLEKQHVARIVLAITGDRLSREKRREITNSILGASDVDTLAARLDDLAGDFGGWDRK